MIVIAPHTACLPVVVIQASGMSLHDGEEVPQAMYVLVRVSSIRNEPEVVMYPDPWRCLFGGHLRIVSDVNMTIASS